MPKQTIFFLGALPPPVHGMSVINERMLSVLSVTNEMHTFNIVPSSYNRFFGTYLWYLLKLYNSFLVLLLYFMKTLCIRWHVLYVSIAGGYGQLFEIPFVLIARLMRKKIVVQHHSFAYVNNKSFITEVLFTIAGSEAFHVVLCNEMAKAMEEQYVIERSRFIVISNSVFVDQNTESCVRNDLRTIGFMGNVCVDKGIIEFLDVCATAMDDPNLREVKFIIAGPFMNHAVKEMVMDRLNSLPNARYVGSKYGDDKLHFFKGIDLLLFPTKYRNEAEPVTIYEALSFGVPVISYDKGCIKEILRDIGIVVDSTKQFCPEAIRHIVDMVQDGIAYNHLSEKAREHFELYRAAQLTALNNFVSFLR